MKVSRWRKEDFGYFVQWEDGTLSLHDNDVRLLLERGELKDPQIMSINSFICNPHAFWLSSPLVVWFELTHRCNLKCKHCYLDGGVARQEEMSTHEIFRVLEELADAGVFGVYFTGGEPLLHKDYVKILRYALDLNLTTGTFTNGTCFTEELIKSLPREAAFAISLDGIQSFKRLRGNITFNKMKKIFHLLQKHGISFLVTCTENRLNLEEIPELIKWTYEQGIEFRMLDILPLGRVGRDSDLIPTPGDLLQDLKIGLAYRHYRNEYKNKTRKKRDNYLRDKDHKNEWSVTNLLRFAELIGVATRCCVGGRSIAYINASGDLYPCSNCVAQKSFKGLCLNSNGFRKAWEESFEDFRKITWDDFRDCSYCDMSAPGVYCDFRCPVLSYRIYNSPLKCGATPFLIKAMRQRIELKTYIDAGGEVNNVPHEKLLSLLQGCGGKKAAFMLKNS